MSANLGATCTYIPAGSDQWATMRCGDRKNNFMCEKLPGKVGYTEFDLFKYKISIETL